MSKPIIAYIEDKESEGTRLGMSIGNPKREALSYLLRQDYGCEVINYDNNLDLEASLPNLKRYFSFGQLILVIIRQESSGLEHQRALDLIRQDLSTQLPIIVIPVADEEKRFQKTNDKNVYSFFHEDKRIGHLVRKLKNKWRGPLDWLGAETKEDQGLLYDRLKKAYEEHYLNDDILGIPDHNHMIVAEALRLKCLPISHVKAEFDDTIENLSFFNLPSKPSDYLNEVERIKQMSPEEKENFFISVMKERGYQKSGNSWLVTRSSCGPLVNGFAIDPITSETLVTTQSGMHHQAGHFLSLRIDKIEELRDPDREYVLNSAKYCKGRLITGLIFLKVLDFKTPILMLNHEEEYIRNLPNVMSFISNQPDFIIIDCGGNLLS